MRHWLCAALAASALALSVEPCFAQATGSDATGAAQSPLPPAIAPPGSQRSTTPGLGTARPPTAAKETTNNSAGPVSNQPAPAGGSDPCNSGTACGE